MKYLWCISFALLCALTYAADEGLGGAADTREEPYLVVTYVEGRVQLRSKTPQWRDAKIGDVLKKNDVIRTDRNSTATLTITKGGNILLREESVLLFDLHEYDSVFRIETTRILVRYGKIRLRRDKFNPASKLYVATPHQSNLLTGTDIVVEVRDRFSTLSVFDGSVLSANITGLGKPVTVPAGKTSTTGPDTPPTMPATVPDTVYIEWNSIEKKNDPPKEADDTAAETEKKKTEEIRWQKVEEKPATNKPAAAPVAETVKEEPKKEVKPEEKKEAPKEEPKKEEKKEAPKKEEPKKEEPKKEEKPKEPEKPWEWSFKMSTGIGVAYFDDKAYNNGWKFWLSLYLIPEFTYGPVGFGFYLPFYIPIIRDFYAAPNWHNYDEWDMRGTYDTLHDLYIKLYYAQYKKEPVWVRFGSLHEITFGNGYYLNKYNNAKLFPSIRKNGIYANLDFDYAGAEFFDEDFSRNNFIAARAFVRPFTFTIERKDDPLRKLYVGFSYIADFNPFTTNTWVPSMDIVFGGNKSNEVSMYAIGLDVGYPIFKNEMFSVLLYADIGMQGLGFAKVSTNALPAGFWTNYGYDQRLAYLQAAHIASFLTGTNGVVKDIAGFNYGTGWAVGAKGYASILPWRAELRYNAGGNYPEIFDGQYYDEYTRAGRFYELMGHKMDDSLGFLVETGLSFSKVGGVFLTYSEYYSMDTLSSSGNKLHFEIVVDEKVIPNMSGKFTYDRTHIVFDRLIEDIFDVTTVLGLTVTYTIFGPVKVTGTYTRRFVSDGAGGLTPVNSVDANLVFAF
ncbi:MAG: FecR domain-containing protein [Spirochaetes bacterium]|nr:FecR domain-containing protein [Spirochaetota bacterium]